MSVTRKLPSRSFTGDPTKTTAVPNWRQRTINHLVGCLSGRGEGDAIEHVFTALKRVGLLEKLVDYKGFAEVVVKARFVQEAISKWQLHWSTRHSLHIWDKLDLSRSQFENLRHLLSFVYDPATDRYEPIAVCGDPNDPKTCVLACKLAPRVKREALYNELAEAADGVASNRPLRAGCCQISICHVHEL